MNVDPVTARYVGALYELAEAQGALEEVRSDVDQLAAALSDADVREALLDARIPHDTKRGQFERVVADMHALVRNFVGLLFDKRREAVLVGLGAAFRKRFLEGRGAVEGVVESARPLESADIAMLSEALGKMLRKEVLLTNQVVPELVGGVRILVDNRLLDRSVRGRLSDLRRKLHEARVSA